MKTENPDNDAMMDDMAGKAYIEQFGMETFLRADKAVRANKATRLDHRLRVLEYGFS
jgi:vacuolar protein sorting-associated protein VTA1